MDKFALIGKTLKHSYSKRVHSFLNDYQYDLVELNEEQLKDFVYAGEYLGYNVTIPYKKEIMKYLDEIDEFALKIGAVNTVIKRKGKLKGYNTDFFGMQYALERANISLKDKKVMILGSGGTSNMASVLASHLGAKQIIIVSRSGKVNYENYLEHNDAQVIINCTPVGMFPNNYCSPLNIDDFSQLEGVFDAIYNPNLTKFIFNAREKGIKYSNGIAMLVAQAKKAMEIFTDCKKDDGIIEKCIEKINGEQLNLVLIGMAGAGKSTIAKEVAKRLNREFIDTDILIEKRDGRTIPEIFSESGEDYFRQLESEVLKEVGKLSQKVIATGGGIVTKKENQYYIKQNGIVFWIKRDENKLDRKNRPLSVDLDTVKSLFEKRKPLYSEFADFVIDNDKEIIDSVNEIMEKL